MVIVRRSSEIRILSVSRVYVNDNVLVCKLIHFHVGLAIEVSLTNGFRSNFSLFSDIGLNSALMGYISIWLIYARFSTLVKLSSIKSIRLLVKYMKLLNG